MFRILGSFLVLLVSCSLVEASLFAQTTERWDDDPPGQTDFLWQVSKPVMKLDLQRFPRTKQPWLAIKDPSIVRFDSKWHLFCTIRRGGEDNGRIRIGYTSFSDWDQAQLSNWSLLDLTKEYHGAPQIFYFAPQKIWYLIYQAEDSKRNLSYGPCFSTNENLANPAGWSLPQPLYKVPDGTNAGLDYWVICDRKKAYLFFTSLNGKMWRAETALDKFPNRGWSKPEVALQGDIFEASHTYRLAGEDRFLTFVEAQNDGRRYFKAYHAKTLDGSWVALADGRENPFVSPVNVENQDQSWATSYSHGEFLRKGYDQNLEIDLDELTMLFQGVSDDKRLDRNYGQIPWKLGLLELQTGEWQSKRAEK